MFSIPMWVLFVFGGIVVSAFMAVKTGKEERKLENEGIEREGEEYMKRLEREKERRHKNKEEKVFEN
ncbi:sporulation YhaL family protein [Niallia sp. 01092]|uniref:sporulation YhaL family protein n=1 Tax=unclassified Niallia TaxID=2837522 RepID=UPI003FD1E3E7